VTPIHRGELHDDNYERSYIEQSNNRSMQEWSADSDYVNLQQDERLVPICRMIRLQTMQTGNLSKWRKENHLNDNQRRTLI
jgi:hypothetical protein